MRSVKDIDETPPMHGNTFVNESRRVRARAMVS